MPDFNCGSSHVINILYRNSEEEEPAGKFYKFVFVLSWVVIMLLDPFCLYLNSIDDRRMCIMQNTNLKYTFLVLRSIIDLFHLLNATPIFKPKYNFDQGIPLKKAKRFRFLWLIRWSYTVFNVIPFPQIYVAVPPAAGSIIFPLRYAQLAKEMSKKLKLMKKMQMMNLELDLWLSKNADVPKNTSIVIRKHLKQQVKENKDVDIPSRYKRLTMRPLCLDLLKRVTLLEHVDKEVLKAISEHMNSVMYTADCYIIREGEPLGKMFFIRQGTAWIYTTRSNSFVGDGIISCLEKDCFYGEELFEWAFKFESFSNLPVSTITILSQEKVEVFVISAKDLKKIVSILWWHFSSNLQIQDIEESLLRQLKNLAMSSLWRRRKAMLANPRTSSHWDNVYDKLIKSD